MSIFLSIGVFFVLLGIDVATGEKRRVCYYTNWSQYRSGLGKFVPSDIDPFLCTHIAYAFAKLSGNHLAKFEWNDEKLYKETMALKDKNPKLKVILSVGGWNAGTAPFTKMVADDSSRKDFVEQAIRFLRKYNFDGLDIDWEYPANRGGPPSDKKKYALLVKKIRKAFDAEAAGSEKPRLLLSAAVSAGKDKINTGYDVPTMAKDMDFITLMTYDLHGAWEKKTGHNAPLFKREEETGHDAQLNIAWASKYWVSKGAPKSKLNVGLALYGRGFLLSDPSDHKPGASAKGPCPAGKYTKEPGYLSYYEVCQMIKSGGKVHRMKDAKVPYLVKGNEWIGYDDPQSLKFKAEWVKKEGFGGIATWALPLDDFKNVCGGGKYPLMKAIVSGLKGSATIPSEPETDTAKDETSGSDSEADNSAAQDGETSGSDSGVETDNAQPKRTTEFTGCSNMKDGFYKKTCNTYVQCSNGMGIEGTCPEGTAFSTAISTCNFKDLVPGC